MIEFTFKKTANGFKLEQNRLFERQQNKAMLIYENIPSMKSDTFGECP